MHELVKRGNYEQFYVNEDKDAYLLKCESKIKFYQ